MTDADQGKQAQSRVMAAVTHDLRNPLNAIVLSAEVLRRAIPADETSARLRRQVDTITRAADQIERRLKALIDEADLAAGTLELEIASVDVVEIFDDVASYLGPVAAVKRIALQRDAVESGLRARCDRLRTGRIVSDLVRCEMRASSAGGEIRVSSRCEASTAVFRISGPLGDEDRDALGRSGAVFGSGLQVVRALTEIQGGTIHVEPGFIDVRLPLA